MPFGHARNLTLLSILISLCSCQSGPALPDLSTDAAHLTGLSDLIHFETKIPTDSPDLTPDTLTLADATRLAILRDPNVQIALAKLRIAHAEAKQSRLLPNPLLNLVARFPEAGGDPVIELALSADLLVLLQRSNSIKSSDAHLRAAAADTLTAVLDSLSAVQSSYANLQAIEEELDILQRRRALVDQLLEIGQARLKAGEAGRLDVITVQTHRLEAEVDLQDLRSQQLDERLALTRLIGQPSSAAEWKITPWQPPPDLNSSEATWLSAAMANRPEIKSKSWELLAMNAQRKNENLAWLQGSDIGAHAEHDQWSLGPAVTVPLPIFDTGRAGSDKAMGQEIQTRHELTQIRRQVIEDVRRAYASYKSSLSTLRLATDQLLPLQQQLYEQSRTAYRAGEIDLGHLLTAEEDLQDTRRKMIDLRKRASVARIKLYRATGGPGIIPDESTSATRPSTQP